MSSNASNDNPKIGIFAGTFDPIHEGHLAFARQAYKECGLTKVYFLAEPRPRRKQGVKALEHRIAMVQLAIKDETYFSTIMLEQARFYVADTLPVLLSLFSGAKLYFLLGEDVIWHLTYWPKVGDLIQSVCFVIGIQKHTPESLRAHIKTMESVMALKIEYQMFKVTDSSISSTKVRQQLIKGNTPKGVPAQVLEYIKENGLYASADQL